MAVVLETSSLFVFNSTGYAYNHTAGNLLVVLLTGQANGAFGDWYRITYNNIPLTKVINHRNSGYEQVQIYYLVDPPTGSNTLSVPNGIGTDNTCAFSFSGVSLSDGPIVDSAGDDAASGATSASVTLDTVDGGYVVGAFSADLGSDRDIIPSAGVTQHDEGYSGALDGNWWAGRMAADASSETFGCTWDNAGAFSLAAVSIRGGSGTPERVELTTTVRFDQILDSVPNYSGSFDFNDAEMLVVAVGVQNVGGSEDVTAVSYNSVGLTEQIEAISSVGRARAFIWTLLAPASGSNTLAITWAGSDIYFAAYGVTGIDTDDPIEATAQSTTLGSVSITPAKYGMTFGCLSVSSANPTNADILVGNAMNDGDYESGSASGVATAYAYDWSADAYTSGFNWDAGGDSYAAMSLNPAPLLGAQSRSAFFFSLAGIGIPAATLAGLYKAGAVAL